MFIQNQLFRSFFSEHSPTCSTSSSDSPCKRKLYCFVQLTHAAHLASKEAVLLRELVLRGWWTTCFSLSHLFGSIPQRFIRNPLSGNLFPIFSGVTAFVLPRTRQRFRISRHQLLCRRRFYMVRTLHRSVLNTGHHMGVGPAVLHPFRIWRLSLLLGRKRPLIQETEIQMQSAQNKHPKAKIQISSCKWPTSKKAPAAKIQIPICKEATVTRHNPDSNLKWGKCRGDEIQIFKEMVRKDKI